MRDAKPAVTQKREDSFLFMMAGVANRFSMFSSDFSYHFRSLLVLVISLRVEARAISM